VPDFAWAAGGGAGGAAAAAGAVPLDQEAVVDNGDGTYAVTYTISEEFEGGEGQRGPLKAHLQVTVNGAAIAGSPFELEINLNRVCRNFVCDPAKKGGIIVLSNGNRTITNNTGGAVYLVLGTESMEIGKHYWEIHVDMRGQYDVGMGLATPQFIKVDINGWIPNADPSNLVGGTGPSNWNNGKAYGVKAAWAPVPKKAWKTGDIIGFYLDLDACELSLFINKEFQGKTPVGAGPFYPAFQVVSTNDAITILHDVDLPAALQ
jgi:hypothetical protein